MTVIDGVVSDGAKKISYGQLIGGKKFNVKITATGTGWDMKVAPEVRAKDVKDHKVVGTSQKRIELPAKLTGEFTYANDVRIPACCTVAWFARRRSHRSRPTLTAA